MPRHVFFGLGAGALWGITFIAPAALGPFTALDLTVVRYLIFGVVSLIVLAVLKFNPFRKLDARGWWRIVGLGLAGNTLFYLAMSVGVVFAGSAPVALLIGTLPIALIVAGNLRRKTVRWRFLFGPVLVLVAGIAVTGAVAVSGSDLGGSLVMAGIAMAAVALLSWLAYGIVNAEYLEDNPATGIILWTSLTGLGTLVTLPPLAIAVAVLGRAEPVLDGDWGILVFWGLLLGLGASWGATWLWNKASSGLSTTVLGLLLVSETVFAIFFVCLYELRPPSIAEVVSTVLIVAGVAWGLRATSRKTGVLSADRDRVVEPVGPE